MNYKLQTFRGFARIANLCQTRGNAITLRLILPLFTALTFQTSIQAQSIIPIPLTPASFNFDCVAEASPPSQHVTGSMPGGDVIYSSTYPNVGSTGMPASNTISNGTVTYNLQPYNGNNALQLTNSIGSSGDLTFQTPTGISKVHLAAFSVYGTTNVDVVVTFSDNTTEQVGTNFTLNDWFNGSSVVHTLNGRVTVGGSVYNLNSGNPRIYTYAFDISPINQSKLVSKVTVTRTGGPATSKPYFVGVAGTTSFTSFNAPTICSGDTEWIVPIDVSTMPADLGAINLVFDYDISKMTYQSIDSAHINLNTASNPIQVTDNNGKMTISWSSTTAAAISNETLMSLKFVPASGASDFSAIAGQTADFTWDKTVAGNCQLSDNTGGVILSDFVNQTGAVINTSPTVIFNSNTDVCSGGMINFTASGGTSYEFFVDGISQGAASAIDTLDYTFINSTNAAITKVIKVTVSNGNSCLTSEEATITVNPLPITSLTSDDSDSRICVGQPIIFTANSTNGADEFTFTSSIDGTVQAQSTTATYTDNGLQDGEIISVIGINSTTGCEQVLATTLTMDVDDCHSISGELVYKNSAETPMGNVVITVTGSGITPTTVTTNSPDGSFTVDNLFDSEIYNFSYAITEPHGGSNATDALLARLDAANIVNQTGVNADAADVDMSGMITFNDASNIQSRFVFSNVTSFPAGVDWVFDAGSFTPTSDITNQKIYALAMGDVDGSYTPGAPSTSTITMAYDDVMTLNDGDRRLIPIRIRQTEDIGAISLEMLFPSSAMTIHDVMLGDSTPILNDVDGDELRVSWASLNSKILTADDVLCYIDATINDVAAYGANPFSLSSESELADDMGTVIPQVMLGVPAIYTTNTNEIAAATISLSNFPNPFSNQMTIEYDLSATSDVSIQIFNALGQEITQLVNETQQEGKQRVIWNADTHAGGIYFYTITVTKGSQTYKATKQVVLIK